MPRPMNVEPFGGGFFAAADFIADSSIENLRAAARDRAEPSCAQSFQCVTDRHPEDSLRQMADFDRGKGLDVKIAIKSAQSLQKFQIPFFLQRGVQSAHHVHLGNAEAECFSHYLNNFVDRIFEGMCIALFGSKSAELARHDADV